MATVEQSAGGDLVDAATVAAVVHELLPTVRLVIEAAQLLERKWPVLDGRDPTDLLALIHHHAALIEGRLEDLARGHASTAGNAVVRPTMR